MLFFSQKNKSVARNYCSPIWSTFLGFQQHQLLVVFCTGKQIVGIDKFGMDENLICTQKATTSISVTCSGWRIKLTPCETISPSIASSREEANPCVEPLKSRGKSFWNHWNCHDGILVQVVHGWDFHAWVMWLRRELVGVRLVESICRDLCHCVAVDSAVQGDYCRLGGQRSVAVFWRPVSAVEQVQETPVELRNRRTKKIKIHSEQIYPHF